MRAARAGQADLRHDLARGRPGRPDARDAQRDADEPVRHRALLDARERRPGSPPAGSSAAASTSRKTPERLTLHASGRWRARRASASSSSSSRPPRPGRIVPILRTDDLAGAVWIPATARPTRPTCTQSLAKGARMRGATHRRGRQGHRRDRSQHGRVAGVRWTRRDDEGAIALRDPRQLRAASGRAQFGALRRRQRAAVRRRALLHRHQADRRRARPTLPVMRDPDGFIYYKEEVGGLVMGGFEPEAKPWNVEPIPDGFEFQLLPEDWDQFEILMKNAIHRTPCLETARGQDAAERAGELHARRQLHPRRGAGARAATSSAPASTRPASPTPAAPGKLVAEWIVGGEAPLDLWDVDIRRFAPFHANRRHLADRTVEIARPALRDALAARGARDRAAAAPLAALRPAAPRRARCSAAR